METEETLIPYHETDLTGKKVLVLAPHPDDETIGCGGSLVRHRDAGDPVKVVFLTNGAAGDSSGKYRRDQYVAIRQEEAERACTCLGVTDLEFWGYEDRSLAGSRGALRRLIDLLADFRPELVYAPSPMEIHPDHRAAAFLLSDAVRSSDLAFEIAFYEIGQPISVNLLVDISGVLDRRIKALETYESQLKERPYKDVSLALNRYRSITLAGPATHAEGYFLCEASLIRKSGLFSLPFQRVQRLVPGPHESGPLVSVIVRTKDRPVLLANALRSVADQTYANIEIVVVNDGGEDVREVVDTAAGSIPATYIAHERGKGRAAAANAGLKAARGRYLNFLDDDDVFLPDHVETLVSYLTAGNEKVAYSSVLSVYFTGPVERPEHRAREEVVFNLEFDPDILLFQNYIPLMSVLFSRDVLSKAGDFSEEMDLFEDWDFWIRVSRHFPFHHIDRITAEYRFYGVSDAEGAHREKYRYDSALAAVFDRVKPLLSGGAWVNFLNNGSMGRFRLPGLAAAAKMVELEQRVAACQKEILGLKERLEDPASHGFGTGVSTDPSADRRQGRKGIRRVHGMAGFAGRAACRVWTKLSDIVRK